MHFAWEAFLLRYRPLAAVLARNLTGRPAEAEDVVQEAVLALLRAHRGDGERFESAQHARNYLLRTVRNLAARAGGERHRLSRLEDEPEARAGDDRAATEVRERHVRLAGLLRELAPEEAELVARRFLRGETLAQVSTTTGIAISTLHSRERAVLRRLRASMERMERGSSA